MHEHTKTTLAPPAEWQAFLAANPHVEAVDAFVIDVNGNTAGKRLPATDGAALYADGVQFSACALIADSRGLGQGPLGIGKNDGDPDGTAKPIAGLLKRVPWTTTPTAQVVCHMVDVEAGDDLWFDPRAMLRDVVASCRAAGLQPVVACELEFYLIDPRRGPDGQIQVAALPGRTPARRAANLSLEAVEDASAFLSQVAAAAAVQDLPVCGAVAEYGIGQYEVNLRHVADPLLAADHAVLLKRLVKGVARSMGMDATFMAKPFATQPGSGLHVHVSLVDDDGRNRFAAPGGEVLLRQSIAGMQALMYDSMALFAPNFNSQRRYLGLFVPTTRDWANNNRSVAFRVPATHGQARRIEHRVAGADASPHLTVAGVLAALLHGVSHGLEATAPAEGRVRKGGEQDFPADLMLALARFEKSALLAQYLPGDFLRLYAELKRGEYGELIEDVFTREYDFYA
ncbi:MAG TPA: glutamine synthetase family protein [Steroidobacteraceae bacterium]|nr:glutamine synthetase family protein [Steroidobacteraceae bacterium]